MPRVALALDPAAAGLTAAELCARLWAGDPAIAVEPRGEGGLYLTPDCLEPGEEAIVADRIAALVGAPTGHSLIAAR